MMTGLIARARSLWRGARRRGAVEAEMAEEFRLHLELRAADLERAGLSPAEARRQARLDFGCAELHRDAARAARGLHVFDGARVSWLDVKLGFRMLAKYPGLTVVGGLAMAFAIWAGAGCFEVVSQMVSPRLPLPDGERVVGIHNWDAAAGRPQYRALHDFVAWRTELESVEELGAFRTTQRNVITEDGAAEPVEFAEISASAFRVTRVRPLLGRALVEADEHPGAAPVVVIGHDVWQGRFGGDPEVVGRRLRVGGTPATVVGVMPPGYTFPINQSLWVPLRYDALSYRRGEGPAVRVFGRLAPGATLAGAQAELTTLGRRAAAAFPETHEHLRPRVMPFARSIFDFSGSEALFLRSTNVFLAMFLVLVCGNVALLTFARAATREGEIVVRSALGASRGRIVTQLFAEALVLGGVAAAVGLGAAGMGLRWLMGAVEGEVGRRLPFWVRPDLSPETVLYALTLTILGAVVAGVVPGLKVTRGLQARLRQASAGAGGLRFGGVWTAVIVAQVAVTVAFPMTSWLVRRDAVQIREIRADFPAAEFLSARLDMDRDAADATDARDEMDAPAGRGDSTAAVAYRARFHAAYRELERRLAAEPGVVAVTFAEQFPRMYHPHRLIEVDAGGAAPLHPDWPAYRVSAAAVDADYFDVLGAPLRAGRGFHPGDLEPGARAVIVNQSFVEHVLGGRSPIGRRLRYVYAALTEADAAPDAPPGPWHEIVGVAPDLGTSTDQDPKVAAIYHPLAPGAVTPLHVGVRVRGDPAAFAPRLRAVASAVDPTLRLDRLVPMAELSDAELRALAFWFRITVLVSVIAVLLSLTGIYAVMSFTVSRRTREIGIRVALGSDRRRVVAAIFRRPLTQVGLGVGAGGILIAGLAFMGTGGVVTARGVALLVAYAALMLGVCLLACVVPTRRALGVEPTEALRADG
jgi:putative ABC transport system permease protein